MDYGSVSLKKGKERAVLLGHHWIFSGAVQHADALDGSIVKITAYNGDTLGYGYYNSRSQIRVRVLSFGDTPFTHDTLRSLIVRSIDMRRTSPLIRDTNAVRLVFSEGDFIPGLIVDRYDTQLVMQCFTLGIDVMKGTIADMLNDILKPVGIYERSDHPGRTIEGLVEQAGQLRGNTPDEIEITEHGVRYTIDVKHGQKTGFFIDQRENRALVRDCASGKKVLNLFSYTGGFTFASIMGGAASTKSVDISESARILTETIYNRNGFTTPSSFVTADAFEYLRSESIVEDLVIIDPPAFAKRREDVDRACRGYKDINLQLFRKVPTGSIVLTCSCSRFIDADLFRKVVFSAVCDAGRSAQILRITGHPADHPVNIAVPETEYLKGLLLLLV
jgi:23S rRNA (cytosine1962-C5)-methyltransferase